MFQMSNARSTPAPFRTTRRAPLRESDPRKLERRVAILRAAARAFREHGFASSGMREIARAADVSAGNLYYWFESKEDLLFFCQDYSLDRLIAAATDAKSLDAPSGERLRRVIEAHVRCTLDELDGALAHLEVDALPVKLRARIVRKRDRYELLVRGLVEEGIEAGELRRCDAAVVTRAMLGALNWTARWYRPGGRLGLEAIAATYSDYLLRGVLPREAGQP
jgi:AcrR family transcriptional regulator